MELVEGEEDVINMSKVDGSMLAAVNSLKHEYATTVTARITPGDLSDVATDQLHFNMTNGSHPCTK